MESNMNSTVVDAPANPNASLSERVRSLRLPENGGGGQGGSSWLPWVLCLVLLLVAGFFAMEALSPISDDMLKKLAEERKLDILPSAPGNTPQGGVANPAGGKPSSAPQGEVTLESKGYILPIRQIQVSPQVGGKVIDLFIEEGAWVQEGQILAKLETDEYQFDYDRIAAQARSAESRWKALWKYREDEVNQAKAELDDSRAQRDQWLQKYKRSVALKDSRALSPEEFENIESNFRSQEARLLKLQLTYDLLRKGPRDENIAAAKSEWEQFSAEAGKAKWRLDYTTIRAPVSGIILSKKAEKGNMVNPSAFSNGLAASLCDMANLYELEIDLSIAERDISKVKAFQECRIRAEAYMDRDYQGYVSRVMPAADRAKGSIPVRVRVFVPRFGDKTIEKQGEYLRPEMGAYVTFFNRQIDESKIRDYDLRVQKLQNEIKASGSTTGQ
jgi:HlyD family secretion protein